MVCKLCHKKHDYANYDQFLNDFYDDTKCLCTKFEVIWTYESRVIDQKNFGILKMDWCAILQTNMAAAL